jgi:hypothetical protein
MSTAELKSYVDERSPEERRWLAQYLWKTERDVDTHALAELAGRMDEMEAGKNTVSWAEAAARLDNLDRQGK